MKIFIMMLNGRKVKVTTQQENQKKQKIDQQNYKLFEKLIT